MPFDLAKLATLIGDSARSRALTDDLDKRFPEDTVVRFNYLPTLRAQLALNLPNSGANTVEALAVTSPYEIGVPAAAPSVLTFTLSMSAAKPFLLLIKDLRRPPGLRKFQIGPASWSRY